MCAQALINYWNENKDIADKNGDGKLDFAFFKGEIGQQDVVLRTHRLIKMHWTQLELSTEIIAEDTANWDRGAGSG